ncbi:MAG: hypothetical protein ACLFTT_00425 [Candidatus Hydrogenedentota bacterium]
MTPRIATGTMLSMTPPGKKGRKKGPVQPAGHKARIDKGPQVRWTGFRPFVDAAGNPLPRHYNLETLATATEFRIEQGDRFILPSIQRVLGPAHVNSLVFDLVRESAERLVFRMRAGNARRKSGTFAYVAAKDSQGHSKTLQEEHRLLGIVYGRAPKYVVKPFLGGTIYMPDRHGRARAEREIFAYITAWPGAGYPLALSPTLQFVMQGPKPHTLTRQQTEQVKVRIVEIMAATYSAQYAEAIDIPDFEAGHILATMPDKGLKVSLVGCRKLLRRLTPAKYVDRMITATRKIGGVPLHVAPEDPGLLLTGLRRALGKEESCRWLRQYLDAVHAGALKAKAPAYVEAIERLNLPPDMAH